MTPMSAAVGASLLAHGLHVTMLLLGLWGLVALLLPHTLDRVRHADPHLVPARDLHDVRVRELRATLLDRPDHVESADMCADSAVEAGWEWRLGLPLLVVSSAAAAGIHFAVAPHHLDESTLVGSFFLVSGVTQALWALVALEAPSRGLLRVGVVANAAILALWACTRTLGLPFGILPGPEAVGGWDVVCACWEVLLVGTGLVLLRPASPIRRPQRCPGWFAWHPAARAAVGLAAVSLTLLTLLGGHS